MDFPLSPKARKNGRGYIDHCPAHNDNKPSLSINMGADGKLLLHCFAGCSFEEIMSAAGLRKGREAQFVKPQCFENSYGISQKNGQRAKSIWTETKPLKDTLGEVYYKSRGLTIWSNEVRYHPSLYEVDSRANRPAVVCAVRNHENLVGIHRTFLNPDGSKLCKKMLGPCRGASVYVGGSGKDLVLCEGIENALSALRMLGWGRATFRSALSATGLKNFILPKQPGKLLLLPDGDEVGKTAAIQLGERAAGLGWQASTLFPPYAEDWNDYLIRELEKQNAQP